MITTYSDLATLCDESDINTEGMMSSEQILIAVVKHQSEEIHYLREDINQLRKELEEANYRISYVANNGCLPYE